jgi:cell division septation protein DedD
MTSNNDQFSPDMVADEEQLTPFDVRDSSGRQGLLKLAIGFVVLLAIALVLLKIYHPGGARDRNETPRITAENTPFKVTPEDAEGMQVPDQNRKVFDVMDGKVPEETVTDVNVPEVPITLPKTNPSTTNSGDSSTANIQVDPPRSVGAQTTTNTPVRRIAPPTQVDRAVRSGDSEYVVQVASVRSQADANKIWTDLERRFSALIGPGLYADIKRVDLNEKGIYYRTRVAGLADKPSANELCRSFKAANQACYVTKK